MVFFDPFFNVFLSYLKVETNKKKDPIRALLKIT